MVDDKPTTALRKARESHEAKERARFGGFSGRIRPDKRVLGQYAADLQIGLDEIGPDGLLIKEQLPAAWLDHVLQASQAENDLPQWLPIEEGLLDIKLIREQNLVRLAGQLYVVLSRACDRCLLDTEIVLEQPWAVHFLPAPLSPDMDFHLGAGEMGEAHAHLPLSEDVESGPDASFYDKDMIDLQAALCEEIFLNLPTYLRCDHPKAREKTEGCQNEAANGAWTPKNQENWVDPRWAGLEAFRTKLTPGPDETQ